ncbi:MAG: pantoate--beta-alanine ligase [Gemmatimonadales bacterium]
MIAVTAIADVRDAVANARAGGARIGFVPTMGALHRGHLSLVDRSRREADVTVMSIFVNPLQFGPNEDLSRYPRPVAEDARLAAEAGVDILFRPGVADMYPPGQTVSVSAGELGSQWEGASRPGHFDGVLTVVAKLFSIVTPDLAVFGRKDLQQAALVQALVRDLDIPVAIVLSPVVRESDGLAMSSRNRYLSAAERKQANVLSQALASTREAFAAGTRETSAIEAAGASVLATEPDVRPDYFAVVDPSDFGRRDLAEPRFATIVAARVGATRLIDNMSLGQNDED